MPTEINEQIHLSSLTIKEIKKQYMDTCTSFAMEVDDSFMQIEFSEMEQGEGARQSAVEYAAYDGESREVVVPLNKEAEQLFNEAVQILSDAPLEVQPMHDEVYVKLRSVYCQHKATGTAKKLCITVNGPHREYNVEVFDNNKNNTILMQGRGKGKVFLYSQQDWTPPEEPVHVRVKLGESELMVKWEHLATPNKIARLKLLNTQRPLRMLKRLRDVTSRRKRHARAEEIVGLNWQNLIHLTKPQQQSELDQLSIDYASIPKEDTNGETESVAPEINIDLRPASNIGLSSADPPIDTSEIMLLCLDEQLSD
eukprot:m.194504 g.194504  ORF g.194504 m.194504 type:complete len:311 (+) comp16792_c0_seq2:231-1163(+)